MADAVGMTMLQRLRDEVVSKRDGQVRFARGGRGYVVVAEWAHGDGFLGCRVTGDTREAAAGQALVTLHELGLIHSTRTAAGDRV